jgi:hypothetical protein
MLTIGCRYVLRLPPILPSGSPGCYWTTTADLRCLSQRLESFQKLSHVDDFSIAVLLHNKQIFVASDEQIGSRGCCQSKEIIVTGISADCFDVRRAEQFGSP